MIQLWNLVHTGEKTCSLASNPSHLGTFYRHLKIALPCYTWWCIAKNNFVSTSFHNCCNFFMLQLFATGSHFNNVFRKNIFLYQHGKNGLKIICYSQFLQPKYFCCGTNCRASPSRTFQEICNHRYQKQFATVSSLMPPQVASGRYCLERWFNYEIFAAPRRRWALGPGGARGALCACSGSRDSVIIERKENATPSHKSIQEEKNHWSHWFITVDKC